MGFDGISGAGGINPAFTGGTQGAEDSGGVVGSFHNSSTVSYQKDAMSLLSDMAEEIGLAHQEKAEKRVADRKKKEAPDSAEALAKARLAVHKMQDANPQDLEQFLKQLKAGGASSQKIKELLVGAYGGDRTKQHWMLSEALEHLEDAPELKAAVNEALKELEAEHAPEILAGYNIDKIDAGSVGGAGNGRDLYNRTILGHADIGKAFIDLFDRYGADKFGEAMEFLRQAIGADLSAATPSSTEAELKTANDDLAHVQILRNIHRDCVDMLDKLGKTHKISHGESGDAEALKIVKHLLSLKDERMVMPDRVKPGLPLLGDSHIEHDINLVTETKGLVHKFPMKIYQDSSTRQNLLDGVQGLLDRLIDREDELLAKG
jgi:type III secretion system YopN/LcrE/InvE/MxiC family regulator